MCIKQADRLPERPKAINAGCPNLNDNTNSLYEYNEIKEKKEKNTYIQEKQSDIQNPVLYSVIQCYIQ